MRMVALTKFAEEEQPEHVFFCRPFFCDAAKPQERGACS